MQIQYYNNMRFVLIFLLALAPYISNAQKIVKYTAGTEGTADYRELTFWSDKHIIYKQGLDVNEYSAQYIGTTFQQYEKAFIIQLPHNVTYRVIPMEDGRLSMSNLTSSDYKILKWIHDGPVNAKGICLQCAVNEAEALSLLKKTYM